jgi:hypothetical protein
VIIAFAHVPRYIIGVGKLKFAPPGYKMQLLCYVSGDKKNKKEKTKNK